MCMNRLHERKDSLVGRTCVCLLIWTFRDFADLLFSAKTENHGVKWETGVTINENRLYSYIPLITLFIYVWDISPNNNSV